MHEPLLTEGKNAIFKIRTCLDIAYVETDMAIGFNIAENLFKK